MSSALVIPPHGSYVQMEHWYAVPLERPVSRGGIPKKRARIERFTSLLEAAENVCGICGNLIDWNGSIDHVVPRSRGGDDIGNLIAAHITCNQAKANRPPTGCELIWLAGVNARLGIPA